MSSFRPIRSARLVGRGACKGLALAALACAVVGAGPASVEVANWARLASMPVAARQRLAANLARFEAMAPAERAAIEAIDGAISGLSEAEQHRYVDILNRYHVWLSTQDAATRERLAALEPAARLKAVEQLRLKERERRSGARARISALPDQIQVSALVTESMRVSAIETRLWFMLQPEQRKTVLAKANPRDQRKQLLDYVENDAALQAERARLVESLGIDLKELREAALRKLDRAKRPNLAKNGPLMQELQRAAELKRLIRNAAPEPVTQRNLERFDQSMPPWVRESIDALPPDAALTRLRLLYRLVFPSPEELPEPKVEAKSGGQRSRPEIDPNAKPF